MYAAYLLSMPNDDLVLISDLQGSKLHLNATIVTTEVRHKFKSSILFMYFISIHLNVHIILHTSTFLLRRYGIDVWKSTSL
jgi:hypothetical protein